MDVTVIGAGIGGMATAIGLIRAGHRVEVLERADRPDDAGAALGLWPTAMTALRELGIDDAVRARARVQGGGEIRREDGRRIAVLDTERLRRRGGSARPAEPVHLIRRRDLARVLAGAVPAGTVRFGVTARADDPGLSGRDLVVVADGVFSASRRVLFGDRYAPRYTGHTAWRGTAPIGVERAGETWGAGARFGLTPLNEAVTNWYASAAAPESARSADGEPAELRRRFGRWHHPIPELLAALTPDDVDRHDLYDLGARLPSYVRGTAVLIGDAAHAMTPDLGRGACEALLDATALCRHLGTAGDVATALTRYDRERRRRTQRLASLSYRMSRVAHARRLTTVRDTAIRLLTRGM
jgi:2-polyprenyl-6-methoxyphenol hydroxylase-like FAD-dependent oxidoreductase